MDVPHQVLLIVKVKSHFLKDQLACGFLKKLEEAGLLRLGAKLVKALGANVKAISWKCRVFNKSCHFGRLQKC